jgi:hypothetical protein
MILRCYDELRQLLKVCLRMFMKMNSFKFKVR